MSGWSKQKRQRVEQAFYQFLDKCWINSKDKGRICLGQHLYDGQEQFITAVFDALEEDIHRIFVLKSRQLGLCYDPNMRVLTADLRWVPIKDLRLYDKLVAIDEYHAGRKNTRKMRTAEVHGIRTIIGLAYKLTMSNGVELIATAEHRHLAKVRGAVHTEWRSVGNTKVGDSLSCVTETWGESDYEDGWMGGLLDGEGSISLPTRKGAMINVSQVAGPVLDRARSYFKKRNYSIREEVDTRDPGHSSKFGKKAVYKLNSIRMNDMFRLIGQTRPSRFINRYWWEGKEPPGKKSGYGWYQVVSIEPLGLRDMIDIQTSRKTFICEGFVSHNSTISRALTIFYLGIHHGLKGALVFDTAPHKESARKELVTMIKNLPTDLKFPTVLGSGSGNRESISLENESSMLFMSAGVKESKSSGTLGRSEGLTLAHLSELCSYSNEQGIKAFEQSLSEEHPNRLYIYESTARGYNSWKVMWDKAKADPRHCKALFLGWYTKPSQSISRDHPDFKLYGLDPPTESEQKRITAVLNQYGHVITAEQLAWIRKKVSPEVNAESDEVESDDDPIMLAEQAWTEEEAFQQSGAVFFANKDLTDLTNKYVSRRFKSFMFLAGEEFADMKIYKADNPRSCELKVWEEPDPEGVYVFGVDPAYGENEENCNSSIQIMRCYADGLDQVAEYAWPLQTTRHLAWTLSALLGWYGASPRAECRYILELNGPGSAVFNEIKNLKFYIDNAVFAQSSLEEQGLMDIFKNVKTYIYTRPDSMGAGYNYHWKTNTFLKITLMEQLRDVASSGKMRIRSLELIDEMRSIAREGDSIGAPSSLRDDRTIAMALANYYWLNSIRKNLIGQRRTRAAEESRQRLSIVDQVALFNQNSLDNFFAMKSAGRRTQAIQAVRNAWRNGSGRRY